MAPALPRSAGSPSPAESRVAPADSSDTASRRSLPPPPAPSRGAHIPDQRNAPRRARVPCRKKVRGTLYRPSPAPISREPRSTLFFTPLRGGTSLAPLSRRRAGSARTQLTGGQSCRERRRRPGSRASGGRIFRIRSGVTAVRTRDGPCSSTRRGARVQPIPTRRGPLTTRRWRSRALP